MLGTLRVSIASEAAAGILKFEAYLYPHKKKSSGEPMTEQRKTKLLDRAQRMQDILLASSFAVWAFVLASPVFAIRSLMGI